MRSVTGLSFLLAGLFLAVLAQEAVPPIHALQGARVVLIPMVFCYGAMVLPFWAMVVSALIVGVVSDLLTLHVVGGRVEIALGWSIVFFVIVGSIGQGMRPLMEKGRWAGYVVLASLSTSLYLLLQFAMISFRREGLVFNELVVWRILAPGVIAALLAPILHAAVATAAQWLPREHTRRVYKA